MSSDAVFLIVCSDLRSLHLAQVLDPHGAIYRRGRKPAGGWQYSVLKQGAWSKVADKDAPAQYLATFFHVGRGDPLGLPKSAALGKIFAFSGAGVSKEHLNSLKIDGIAISRPFREGWSVLQPRDVTEFLSFARGESSRVPAFCEADKSLPAITALAILCQTFVSAGVAAGQLPPEHPLAVRVGWNAIPVQIQKSLGQRLQQLWPRLAEPDWWRRSIGAGELPGEAFQRYLEQLCYDIGIDLDISKSLPAADELLAMLKVSPVGKAIIPLFIDNPVTPDLVANAYSAITSKLESC